MTSRNQSTKSIGILGTGSAVPERVLTNADLEAMVDTSDEWIVSRTGIRERRIADEGVGASHLAYRAALKALARAGTKAEELDLIICATVTPDMAFPATACLVQELLGVKNIPAFDLSAGCSGFGYALTVAESMLKSGTYQKALVVGVDILSRITDYEDRSTSVLFGDGAGAAILGEVPPGFGFLATEIGADGASGGVLSLPAGGSLQPASLESVQGRQHYIKMQGSDVFKFAVRIIEEAANRVVAEAGLNMDDITWLVPHQANIRIIRSSANRLGVPEERFFVNVDRYGNTSAASIGLALDELAERGDLKSGDSVVLVGFGAGLTWSALVLKWFEGGRSGE
ncbi:MAG: ketoacyl-ACP synthase III [Firmicutes bacterium]|nr:ketoacyl-ACP synthase III [Bacillota bacterium]